MRFYVYGLPKVLLNRLQLVQNRAARIVTFTKIYEHITLSLIDFISKLFKDFLKSKSIPLYHTENEEKSTIVERWNRTMKNRMWKMFSANNNTVYWD